MANCYIILNKYCIYTADLGLLIIKLIMPDQPMGDHMNSEDNKAPKYADSSISDAAFKKMILWFALYAGLFCLGVIFVVNADKIMMSGF